MHEVCAWPCLRALTRVCGPRECVCEGSHSVTSAARALENLCCEGNISDVFVLLSLRASLTLIQSSLASTEFLSLGTRSAMSNCEKDKGKVMIPSSLMTF